tara:strand:+ start:651 stop:1373 length:723 start_codon:yes stop_codon:yes gene_type:complete
MKLLIKLFFILFLFTSNKIISQESAICIYKVYPTNDFEKSDSKNQELSNAFSMLNKALNIAKDFEYILKYNKDESIFNKKEDMISDVNSSSYYAIATALVGRGVFYNALDKNIAFHQIESMGKEFIIELPSQGEWQITKETKTIDGFKVFKAISECSTCANNSIQEVWFTPEISTEFGPLGLNGLPGLILEVKKKGFILRLDDIQFKEIEIEKPSNGERITYTEYHKLTDQARKNAKGSK